MKKTMKQALKMIYKEMKINKALGKALTRKINLCIF